MRNIKNILRHELIGLQCTVIKAQNPSQRGISGTIIDETQKTIVIQTQQEVKTISKKETVFRLLLRKQTIDIDGNFIISRPEDRIKKKFRKW